MYPKDLRRHRRLHAEHAEVFACGELGCTAKYNRKDNLVRHCQRKGHSDTRSNLDTESTAASHFDNESFSTGSHLIVQMPANPSPMVDHAVSFATAQSEWSSFDEFIDPSLV
jgi:hypothetical protein